MVLKTRRNGGNVACGSFRGERVFLVRPPVVFADFLVVVDGFGIVLRGLQRISVVVEVGSLATLRMPTDMWPRADPLTLNTFTVPGLYFDR